MNTVLTGKRNLGVNFHGENAATIQVWAPHARRLTMEVEGKGSIPLTKMQYGYWQASCPGLQPGDRYLLNINNKNLFPDPASLAQPLGVHNHSECVDLNEIRKIHNPDWKGIPLNELIIYELHVGTFTPEGTFTAMAQKLDYLKDLGINAVKIMPVASFPGSRNWGYDGVFPFAVQQSYGGPQEFAKLVKACHDKGIAVILDVVYNHLGPEGNYLGSYGPYFTGKYTTPWGKAINFDDAWCDGVRHYFLENALMWMRDFHVDGLRLDAVHAIKDFSPRHFLRELSEHVEKLNNQKDARHFLIAECDLNDTRYINPLQKDGYGLDAQWCDEWHHALHALLTGEKKGYYADFGSLQQMVKSFNHAYVYDGNYSPHRKKIFGTPTANQPGEKFVIFTQNHDQTGNRMLGDRLSKLVSFPALKLAAGAMLASPFVPMLFMGEEYAEDSPFLYFVSHGDKHLLEQVRKGRKREFRDFIKDVEPPNPGTEKTFLQSKLKWDFEDISQKARMHSFYSRLIALRKQEPLIHARNRENIFAQAACKEQVIFLSRKTETENLVACMNFSDKDCPVKIPDAMNTTAELLIYSGHEQWGGDVHDESAIIENVAGGYQILLKPWDFALVKLRKIR